MFNKKYLQEIDYLNKKIEQLNIENGRYVTELLQRKEELDKISAKFESANIELIKLRKTLDCDATILSKLSEIKELENNLSDLKQRHNIQTLGFFDLQKDVRYYRDELSQCRTSQKRMLIDKTYYSAKESWYINDDAIEGGRLLEFFASIVITSINLSCDSWFNSITIANAEYIREKVNKIWNNYNLELNKHKVELNKYYLELKLREIDIRLNIYIRQQQDKEEERRQKEIIKEQAKAEAELKKNKEKLERELIHYQLQANKGEDVADKIKEIEDRIETDDFMLTKTRAGWVYIVSNPSLGKDVYKIGITRRISVSNNPCEERVSELSGSNIPFKFTPNCVIFSEDCFKLESNLHKEFNEYRVNKCKPHREFFKIPLKEIESIVKNKYKKDVEFNYDVIDEDFTISGYVLTDNFIKGE